MLKDIVPLVKLVPVQLYKQDNYRYCKKILSFH